MLVCSNFEVGFISERILFYRNFYIGTKFQIKILDRYVKNLMESDDFDITLLIQAHIIGGKRILFFSLYLLLNLIELV